MRILHVVGARPNFMKTAPIMAAMAQHPAEFSQILVHTGQHYDANMSDVFFADLGLPQPDEFLNVGSGTHAQQTARVMMAFEPVVVKHQPDWVMVVGDVNSTLACALVCAKLGIRVAHVEAGLRSRDRTMPEEVNRILTDQLAGLLFTPSRDGDANLLAEGISADKIHFVGNVMIDSLLRVLPHVRTRATVEEMGVADSQYVLATLHRPSNVDMPETLSGILRALNRIGKDMSVLFPVHPRTRHNIREWNLEGQVQQIRLIEPLGYLDFLALMDKAWAVITDSGGVQEETTLLGIPCLTARPNTERPVTVTEGTNQLVASDYDSLVSAVQGLDREGVLKTARIPEYWDGHAAERITAVLLNNGRAS